MDDRIDHDVEGPDSDGSDFDRRKFMQRAGIGAAAVGGAWVAPSVLGTNVAFAQGSAGGPTTIPPSTTTTTDPANLICGTIDWPEAGNNNPSNVASNITFPVVATGSPVVPVSLLSVNGSTARPIPAVMAGPNPPSANYPLAVLQGGAIGANNNFKSLRANRTATGTSGSLNPLTTGVQGFIIAQSNEGGGNTSFSSITNYQEVTFTLSTAVYNLRFQVADFTATTLDPNNIVSDTVAPGTTFPAPTGSGSAYGFGGSSPFGQHRDTLGFNVPVLLTNAAGGVGQIDGAGTYTNPFRRNVITPTAGGDYRIYVTIPGPVTTFTLRYATVGGRGSQWIGLTNMEFGNC